jgi:hypothetical protein
MKKIISVFSILTFLNLCSGQISLVNSGATTNQVNINGTYTQNFDSLASSTSSGGTAWVNNTTIPGWYSSQTRYSANNTSPGLLSTGSLNDTDRALGSKGSTWGLRIVNNSSATLTGVVINYTGEQWYRGANDPQGFSRMFFNYMKFPSYYTEANEFALFNGAGRIAVPELYFDSPNQTDTSASILDGNLTENRVFVSFTLTGLSVAPNEKLWLNWSVGSPLTEKHTLAIDDVQISFLASIPEPSSYAVFVAIGAFAAVVSNRRRRSK